MRKPLKVAEGQRSLKNLEEGGGSLKTAEEIGNRLMNEFDPIESGSPGKLRELEESRRSLKRKTRAEGGRRQPGDGLGEER
jgi:streptomycin 6-kinase